MREHTLLKIEVSGNIYFFTAQTTAQYPMLPPWLKVGRMLSGLRVGSEGYDTRREIARWEANAASISISSGTRIGIALHGTVADFGSEAAARAEIE